MFKRVYTADLFEDLKESNCGKQCYSWEGVETLLNYYDDLDETRELDSVEILGDWIEYGNWSNCCDFDDLVTDYGYLLDQDDDETQDDYIERLIDELERHTTILHVKNGDYLVSVF